MTGDIHHELVTREEALDCTIEGDEGLIGIGVRLGIYLQVFASMFTMAFQRDQGPAFMYAAAALQAALFVALVYATTHGELHASEALVAILLLIVMVLFELLVFTSIFIHMLSGHFEIANEDIQLGSEERLTRTDIKNPHPPNIAKHHDSSIAQADTNGISTRDQATPDGISMHDKTTSNLEDTLSLSKSVSLDIGLTRQKTRLPPPPEQARLNIREAIYASDPLLINDDNLALLARTLPKYTQSHVWASSIVIILLIFGSYIYMVWFWWKGMSEMKPAPCGSIGFFIFAKFEIAHWIRWPIRIVLTISGIALLCTLLQSVCTFLALASIFTFQLSKKHCKSFIHRQLT